MYKIKKKRILDAYSANHLSKVASNCNSFNHLSLKCIDNMWDYHLTFITTFCAVKHSR